MYLLRVCGPFVGVDVVDCFSFDNTKQNAHRKFSLISSGTFVTRLPMPAARSKNETSYVSTIIKPTLDRLTGDPAEMGRFLSFAAETIGVSPILISGRLGNVTRGRVPSTVIAVLLLDYATKFPARETPKAPTKAPRKKAKKR